MKNNLKKTLKLIAPILAIVIALYYLWPTRLNIDPADCDWIALQFWGYGEEGRVLATVTDRSELEGIISAVNGLVFRKDVIPENDSPTGPVIVIQIFGNDTVSRSIEVYDHRVTIWNELVAYNPGGLYSHMHQLRANLDWEAHDTQTIPHTVQLAAEEYGAQQYETWVQTSTVFGYVDGVGQMLPLPLRYDDWAVESLSFSYHYPDVKGRSLHLYVVDYQLHTTTPEQLTQEMFGYENGLVSPVYPGSLYLVFDVTRGKNPEFLTAVSCQDSRPGEGLFTDNLLNALPA